MVDDVITEMNVNQKDRKKGINSYSCWNKQKSLGVSRRFLLL
jgi:hypothetical protein